jgi:hypothetical protein
MSGRSRHWRDGVLITNRKTDRRQSPPRPLEQRLADLNRKGIDKLAGGQVRMAFMLPRTLQGFVGTGKHGFCINVVRGLVQIESPSIEQCYLEARRFLAEIAAQRPAFTALAIVTSTKAPEQAFARHLTVVGGALIVSNGKNEPKVFEAA